jgi:hypothetical protein
MSNQEAFFGKIVDFITGKEVPNVGMEEVRQCLERFLIEEKGYSKSDIEVDACFEFSIGGDKVESTVDLVVSVQEKRFMVLICAPGALGSRHRETLAAARLLDEEYQIPVSIVSDGETAEVLDTITGEVMSTGMETIPDKEEAIRKMKEIEFERFPQERLKLERLILRSYDEMKCPGLRT